MNLRGEVEGISFGFVGFVRSIELGILAQLVVHSPTIIKGMLSDVLITYIYCMVSTIGFFNFYFVFLNNYNFIPFWFSIFEHLCFYHLTLNSNMNINHIN
jgi:hypothetical protein